MKVMIALSIMVYFVLLIVLVLNITDKSKIIKYEILLYENFFYDVPYTIHFRIYNVL